MQRSLSGRSGIENGKNCRNMQKLIPQEFPVKKTSHRFGTMRGTTKERVVYEGHIREYGFLM